MNSDGTVPTPSATASGGVPIYVRPLGFNFTMVVEGRPGGSRHPLGKSAFATDASDPTVRPDLQVIVSRPLGNGSRAVCDNMSPELGGVPGTEPPDFAFTQPISDAMNDLGCRFLNGGGQPIGRSTDEACTVIRTGDFRFVASNSTLQFCGAVERPFSFPVGDTVITVKLRDSGGNLSLQGQMIVRVLSAGSP